MSEITHTHSDTIITYDEQANNWKFTLRGRDRSAESLAKAKEFIDKPVPEKEKPFQRVPAFYSKWRGTDFQKVEVTGVAEGRQYSREQFVWIKGEEGREKASVSDLRVFSEVNGKLVKEMDEKSAAVEALIAQRDALRDKMEPFKLTE